MTKISKPRRRGFSLVEPSGVSGRKAPGFTLVELPAVSGSKAAGFTLVELLAVIAITALLIGVLLPALVGARRSAEDVKCKSNIRQISLALHNYALENKGKFPPNIETQFPPVWSNHWCDVERIGRYLSITQDSRSALPLMAKHAVGGVMVCPADDGAAASYAMNYFASSVVKIDAKFCAPNLAQGGQAWAPNTKGGSKLILVAEQFSFHSDGRGTYVCPGVTPPLTQTGASVRFYPGWEFVGDPRISSWTNYPWNRYTQNIRTDLDWGRHRKRGDGGASRVEARGRANIGFADGHVASFTPDELANRTTGRSKFVALWSPLDYYLERLPRPNF